MLNEYTLSALLERSEKSYSSRSALAFVEGPSLTYAEVGEQVGRLIRFLRKRGLRKGDRIAILSESMPNWGISYFAITGMGCIAVPILPEFHGNEVAHILRHAEAKALFVSERLFDKYTEADVRPTTVILINDFSIVPFNRKKERLKQLIQSGKGKFLKITDAMLAPVKRVQVKEQDLAVIIYTSGTTGHSKGVMLTHANIVSNVLASTELVALNEKDRLLSILPLSHTLECTFGLIAPLYQGSCIYYMDRPPVPKVMLPALARVKPTVMLSVPLVMEKLYKQRILPQLTSSPLKRLGMSTNLGRKALHHLAGRKLYSLFGGELRFLGIGGAALAPEVEQFLIDARFPYAVGYGLTETSPLISGCSPEKMRFQTAGTIIPDVEVSIRNPDPATGEGEIWVLGPNVMKGYFRDPERTAEVLDKEGWFRTGDLGVLDRDGYLSIKGRMKNVIVGPSGENIYPEGIESILNRSEWVLESLVYMAEGQLCARIFLNYEALDMLWGKAKMTETEKSRRIQELLENIRQETNGQTSSFSRIKRIIEQTEPFEKTPTLKIKRYLYVD